MIRSDRVAVARALADRLMTVPGVKAVALGGSHARGCARPDSDIDLGLYYHEAEPFDLDQVRAIARKMNDHVDPVVSDRHGWGRWVNGGAWLTLSGQRVDLLYRSVEALEHTIAECQAGRYEIDFGQQPPFGFFSPTYLGELHICLPWHDPAGLLARLKAQVLDYPDALRERVVADMLWNAGFNLEAFAPKFAARGDAWGTLACLTRAGHQLILALFAHNRVYLINDKTALEEISAFTLAPARFGERLQQALRTPEGLEQAVAECWGLLSEVRMLVQGPP